MATTDVVTGAFSYTGSFIARRLLAAGHQLRTLTNNPRPPTDLAGKIVSAPLDFEDVDGMVRLMRGADTVYNTYWIHSNYGADAFDGAVRRSKVLFAAAREAGIRRLVHISIANPTASTHPYYASKAQLEEALRSTGMSYAIVRPTLVYGEGDVLINNIAWCCGIFRCSPSLATGPIASNPCTSRTWHRSPSAPASPKATSPWMPPARPSFVLGSWFASSARSLDHEALF